MTEAELRQTAIIDGNELDIIATLIGENEWELSIENCLGIRTVWHQSYSSAQLAIDEGIKAIETEGIESFIEAEGFEYLLGKDDI